MEICTIAVECNYSGGPAQLGSVWLFNGDGTADLDKGIAMEALPGWTRIMGPVDYDVAISTGHALKKFFEGSSIRVIETGIAD